MNKYHSNKIETPDGVFHSQGEYKRWIELKWMKKAGQITDLRRQVSFELIPTVRGKTRTERKVVYVADFTYKKNGVDIVEDFKGYRTSDYVIKRKLMLWRYGIEVLETK